MKHKQPNSPGFPPKGLSVSERSLWFDVLRKAPRGALHRSDRPAILLLVDLLGTIRHGYPRPTHYRTMFKLLDAFQMTPASRLRAARCAK